MALWCHLMHVTSCAKNNSFSTVAIFQLLRLSKEKYRYTKNSFTIPLNHTVYIVSLYNLNKQMRMKYSTL